MARVLRNPFAAGFRLDARHLVTVQPFAHRLIEENRMVLRAATVLAALLAIPTAIAADGKTRVPPDTGAMSQSISVPVERTTLGAGQEKPGPTARQPKRIRYTIPAPKRM